MPSGDIWADRPAPVETPTPTEPAPPWWWDVEARTGNAALRRRDGTLVLVVIQTGESWGIYQLRLDWQLIQIRGDRESAMAAALEGARRANLID